MRVLVVTQIFPPEIGALANRMYPIVRELVNEGHQVFVATGMPNYPLGVVFPEYRGKWLSREKKDGYTILRTAYYTAPRNRSRWSQVWNYLSFVPAVFLSGLRAGKVDLVFVTSPPIFPAVAAILLAKLWRAPLTLDIRDLWPDELIVYGGMGENSRPVQLVRAIERWMYRTASLVCATTQSILNTVVERGVPAERMLLAPNGADMEIFRPLPRDNPISREYPFEDRFVIIYSGLLGIKHGLEVFLEAAEILADHPDILFFFLGSGARGDALREEVKKKGLENVLFGGERSVNDIPYILARADLCYAAVKAEPYVGKVISVKIFEYLACGKAVVGGLNGESARVVEESGAGIVVPPGDAPALVRAILSLYEDPTRREALAARGQAYVEENYSRQKIARTLSQRISAVVQNHTSR